MGGGGGGGFQGECERRFEVFVKMQKKKFRGWGLGEGRVWGVGVRMDKWGVESGRGVRENLNLNSLLVKRQIDNPSQGALTGGNKSLAYKSGELRVDVNEEVIFFCEN